MTEYNSLHDFSLYLGGCIRLNKRRYDSKNFYSDTVYRSLYATYLYTLAIRHNRNAGGLRIGSLRNDIGSNSLSYSRNSRSRAHSNNVCNTQDNIPNSMENTTLRTKGSKTNCK